MRLPPAPWFLPPPPTMSSQGLLLLLLPLLGHWEHLGALGCSETCGVTFCEPHSNFTAGLHPC